MKIKHISIILASSLLFSCNFVSYTIIDKEAENIEFYDEFLNAKTMMRIDHHNDVRSAKFEIGFDYVPFDQMSNALIKKERLSCNATFVYCVDDDGNYFRQLRIENGENYVETAVFPVSNNYSEYLFETLDANINFAQNNNDDVIINCENLAYIREYQSSGDDNPYETIYYKLSYFLYKRGFASTSLIEPSYYDIVKLEKGTDGTYRFRLNLLDNSACTASISYVISSNGLINSIDCSFLYDSATFNYSIKAEYNIQKPTIGMSKYVIVSEDISDLQRMLVEYVSEDQLTYLL